MRLSASEDRLYTSPLVRCHTPNRFTRQRHPNSYPVVADGFLQIIGSEGTLTLQNRTRRLEVFTARGGYEQVFTGPHTANEVDGRIVGAFRESVRHFLQCIRDGVEPDTSPRRVRVTADLQVAVGRSIASREFVRVAS